jgi:hypothetical protein
MRYSPAHAAKSGSVPFMLRGPKPAKKILSAAVAGVLGLVPAVLVSSPAMADTHGTITVDVTTASVTEGGNLVFTVKNTGGATATVNLSTTGGAVSGTDFTAPSASISVAAGATSIVQVVTTANNLYEGGSGTSESVVFRAEVDSTNYGVATGAIVDGDAAPTYSLSATPDPVLESDGSPQATVTATLTKKSSTSTVITLNTVDGTAKAGSDYTALSAQTLTVNANSLTGVATVDITKDTVSDTADTENFTVNSTSAGVIQPTNSAGSSTTVNIKDAQTTPELTLTGGGSVAEGSTLTYGLLLNHGSEKEIKVDWDSVATTGAPAAATSGTDFTYPATRTVTIPARQTTSSIAVQTLKDNLDEADESFDVQLKNPQNTTLGTPSKVTGTITQGKDAPKVTIAPASVTEGNAGRSAATFTATLNAASTQTVKVDWTTAADGSGIGKALPGTDFVTKTGSLTFAPGVTTQTFTVEIIGDTIDEASTNGVQASTDGETFLLKLTRPDGDVSIDLSDPGANRTVKILDDDAAPTLVFADKSVKEGNDTTALLTPITLSNASDHAISILVEEDSSVVTGYLADDGPISGGGSTNAPGGNDYALLNGAVTIAPEQTSGYPILLINGDMVNEENEVINLKATPGSGSAYLSTGSTVKTAKVTLENDDKVPDLEVNSISGKEGATVAVTGTVTGQRQGNAQVAVNFAGGSSKGSKAASADDFDNPGVKIINIPWATPNNTVLPVADIKILADTAAEPAETIIGNGSGIANTASVTEGIVTIEASTGSTTPTDPTDPTDPEGEAPTLTASTSTRLGAGTVTLSGKVAAGAEVELWGRTVNADDDAYEKIDDTTASSTGAFSFKPTLSTDGMYFKAMSGDLTSDPVRVYVREDPEIAATSPSKGVVKLVVTGDPKVRGLGARVFRENANGSWTMVGSGILNAQGTFTKTLTGQTSGKSWTFKSYVVGNAERGVLTNWSSYTKTVRVK